MPYRECVTCGGLAKTQAVCYRCRIAKRGHCRDCGRPSGENSRCDECAHSSNGCKEGRNLTTGQAAKILDVAPRTVSKWCDIDGMPHYRIPGSKDRRIPRSEMVEWIERRMPLLAKGLRERLGLSAPRILFVDVDDYLVSSLHLEADYQLLRARNQFESGLKSQQGILFAAVVDSQVGRSDALAIGEGLRCAHPKARIIGILSEDDTREGEWMEAGYSAILRRPVGPVALVREIQGEGARR